MPVTYEAVAQVAHDTENFSSVWVSVARPDAPRAPAPPITSDPPDHHVHRRLLLPSFSPKVIAPMDDEMRVFARGLIADLDGRDTAEASGDYGDQMLLTFPAANHDPAAFERADEFLLDR